MDATSLVAQESVAIDTLGRRIVRHRRFRTLQEKQQIVAEALVPGTSVSQIAQRHGVNTNLVFVWRRLHEQGLLTSQRQRRADTPSPTLLAVKVSDASPPAHECVSNYIEIVLADGTCVRSIGAVDRAALDQVLSLLRR
jgi:transposase